MRKILFALTLSLLFSTVVLAQSTRIGVTGGVTYATQFKNVNGDKDLGGFKFGGTFGVMFDVPMQKKGSFRTGINFVQVGTDDEYTSGPNEIKLERRLNYVEIPLLALFNIPCKTGGGIRLGGGVAPSFAVSGKDKIEINGNKDESDIDFGDETDSDLNWVDFGLIAQAEYEFNGGVFISLMYHQGINRLFVGGSEKDKLYNHYFGLKVGYFFGNGKKK